MTQTTSFSFDASFNLFITIFELILSSAPVGSSQRINLSESIKALAKETLLFSPPDKSLQGLSFKFKMFNSFKIGIISSSLFFKSIPSMIDDKVALSTTFNSSNKLAS